MTEKLIINIIPQAPGGKLDVEDAMQQVLDSIALLRAASGVGSGLHWQLDQASTNSPFRVVAEAYDQDDDASAIHINNAGKRAKRKFASGMRGLARGRSPDWMDRPARQSARRMFVRNTTRIGMTAFDTGAKVAPILEITPRLAKAALRTLERVDLVSLPDIPSHDAIGEVEGWLDTAGPHQGKPALWLRSKVFGRIPCLVPETEIERLGGRTTLEELWKGKRVVVAGRLHYGGGGNLERVHVTRIDKIERTPVGVEAILDREFTSGMEPDEYLDRLRDGSFD